MHGGTILGHPESDSVAISGGRITAHGVFSALKPLVGPRTHLIKLGGRAVAPGFIDSHLHFFEAAAAMAGVSMSRFRTVGELLAALRVAAGRTPPGNWLRAFGCDEALLLDKRGPTRQELDQAVAKNPLRLRHQTLHASYLNSRAIAQLGLETANFRPPPGATLYRDASGHLTGLVVGLEEWLGARLPLVTGAELEARARNFSRELAAAGVTAFTDATVRNGVAEIEAIARLCTSRAICQRAAVMLGQRNLESAARAGEIVQAGGIRLAGLKFMPGEGSDVQRIERRVRIGLKSGLDCAFHATEVEEVEWALGAIEAARRELAPESTPAVCRIEHGGVITPEQLDRIAAAGAWVVTNPGFIYFRSAKYADEPGLTSYRYRARSLRAAGIELAGATDAPVTPARPLAAIAAAVSRGTLEGGTVGEEERLDTADALRLFTRDAARLQRLDAGEVQANRLADLIVLPRDPTTTEAADLMNTAVDMTLIGGRVVYERGRPAVAHSDSADLHST